MVLFEQYARNADAISRIGEDVRTESRANNTPMYYTEAAYGTEIIKEYPCGRRERVRADGMVVPMPTLEQS